jgi:hypothetical protein
MMYCSYCDDAAVSQIPAYPGQVCLQHAVEFWSGLLAYARQQHSQPSEPIVSHATCAVCMELTAERARTSAAIDASGHEPQRPALERVKSERLVPQRVAPERSPARPLHLAPRPAPSALTISTSPWGGISQSIGR